MSSPISDWSIPAEEENWIAILHHDETPTGDERSMGEPDPSRLASVDYLSRRVTLLLTDAERASISARLRFYSMPWLRFHSPTDFDDTLP